MISRVTAEYIWIDGQVPTAKLRSKTKLDIDGPMRGLATFPDWSFDGSSTFQAVTESSDVYLKPVYFVRNPVRNSVPDFLVLCEVFNCDGTPHKSNTRAPLRKIVEKYAEHEPLFSIEQEYTLYDKDGVRPLRWPEGAGFPAPQGRYYCGVGCDEVYGEELVEAHASACISVGIKLSGTNAEVMPAQWEFQLGPLGALELGDQLWLARWILYTLGRMFNISVKLDPKPISGDWNGAGAHLNFSTTEMRRKSGGLAAILVACGKLKQFHTEHIAVYGADNDKRLTGRHETCDINTFKFAVGDRGASVRIPARVYEEGRGYLEDRRPAANVDPYEAAAAMLETVCGDGFAPEKVFPERYRKVFVPAHFEYRRT